MTGQPTLLAVLLERDGLERYGSFCAAYEKAARSLDLRAGGAPSRPQFHRWLSGELRGMPYTNHCRVLEHMFTGYTAAQLFAPCPDGVIPAPARAKRRSVTAGKTLPGLEAAQEAGLADVVAVFTSRSEFASSIRPREFFAGARQIRAAGLSLNMICQQVPDQQWRQLLSGGTELSCLFLDPSGEAIQAREREEDLPPGHLCELTKLNIDVMCRLRDRLPGDAGDRLNLAVYDETIRFNLILVDDHTCVAQAYMPSARGIDSPTLLIRRTSPDGGLFPVFEQVYQALSDRSRPL